MGLASPQLGDGDRSAPAHVAIIMDGNGRWATRRGLPRIEGHRRGADALRRTVEAAVDIGIGQLTVFAFSTENWKRSNEEVGGLFSLIRFYIQRELKDLIKNKVCFNVIGDYRAFPTDVVTLLDEAIAKTKAFTRITLVMALNYGGRQDILSAVKRIATEVATGKMTPAEISIETIDTHLSTGDLPLRDPDLLIRTSGECRVSNFLLWQLSYSEMIFQDVLWPDYGKEHLEQAVALFTERDRRYGKAPR